MKTAACLVAAAILSAASSAFAGHGLAADPLASAREIFEKGRPLTAADVGNQKVWLYNSQESPVYSADDDYDAQRLRTYTCGSNLYLDGTGAVPMGYALGLAYGCSIYPTLPPKTVALDFTANGAVTEDTVSDWAVFRRCYNDGYGYPYGRYVWCEPIDPSDIQNNPVRPMRLRNTFRANGGQVIVKQEVLTDGSWREVAYYFANLTRDRRPLP